MSTFAALLVLANGDWDHMDWGAGWWIVMALGMVLFWGLVAVAVVWIVRELGRGGARTPGREDPLELLDRRLAEGQISVEEYEERRRVLSGHGDAGT